MNIYKVKIINVHNRLVRNIYIVADKVTTVVDAVDRDYGRYTIISIG